MKKNLLLALFVFTLGFFISCGGNNDSIYGVWKITEYPNEGSFPKEVNGKTYQPYIEITNNYLREYISVNEGGKIVITYNSRRDEKGIVFDEKGKTVFDDDQEEILNYSISEDVLVLELSDGSYGKGLRASKRDISDAVDQAKLLDKSDE